MYLCLTSAFCLQSLIYLPTYPPIALLPLANRRGVCACVCVVQAEKFVNEECIPADTVYLAQLGEGAARWGCPSLGHRGLEGEGQGPGAVEYVLAEESL